MGGFAWVTLATNDSYSLGALVLAHSLKQVGTKQQLVVLITPGVTNSMRDKLSQVFNLVQEVNILDSKDESNLRLLKRPELGITFTKLHCWRLTQYDKCVFLDADTLVLENCDELFDREELSAAPDVGWPDCFNSGVFVYRPSNETYNKLISFALEKGSFDGGDQGLLNQYFSDWAHKDITKHLPFIYNMCSTACYSYLPAFKQFGSNAKIIHFIGASKPWLQYFDTETRRVSPSGDLQHLQNALQRWWDIFCSFIHSQLSPQMIRSSSMDAQSYPLPINNPTLDPNNDDLTQLYVECSTGNAQCVWDPWDEYDLRQQQVSINDQITQSQNVEHVESHNTNVISSTADVVHHQIHETHLDSNLESLSDNHVPLIPTYVVETEHTNETELSNDNSCNLSVNTEQCETVIPELDPQPNAPPYPDPIEVIEPTTTTTNIDCDNIVTVNTIQEVEEEAGLAGAFAQLTLGVPRSAEQNALEDHLRRQGWEVGNIDYLGRDSFENIWSKISETLTTSQKTEEQIQAPTDVVAEVAAVDVGTGTTTPATEPIVPVAEPAAPKSEEKPEVVQSQQTPLPEAPKAPVEAVPTPQTPPVTITTVAIIPSPPKAPRSAEVVAEPPKLPPIPLEAPPTPQTPTAETPLPPVAAPEVPVEVPAPPAAPVTPVEAIPVSLTPATPTETLPTPVEATPVPVEAVQVAPPAAQEPVPTPGTPPAPQEMKQPAPTASEAPVCPLQKPAPQETPQKASQPAPATPEAPVCPLQKTAPPTPQEAPQPAPATPEAPVCPLQKPAPPAPASAEAPTCPLPKPAPPAPVTEAPKTPESAASVEEAAPVCQKPETKTEAKPSEESAACPLLQTSPVQQEAPKQKKVEPSPPTEATAPSAAGAPTPTPPPRKGSGPKKGGKSKK